MPGGMRPQREPATDRVAPIHRSNWVASRIGLMSQLPDIDADDPDDEPITSQGRARAQRSSSANE